MENDDKDIMDSTVLELLDIYNKILEHEKYLKENILSQEGDDTEDEKDM